MHWVRSHFFLPLGINSAFVLALFCSFRAQALAAASCAWIFLFAALARWTSTLNFNMAFRSLLISWNFVMLPSMIGLILWQVIHSVQRDRDLGWNETKMKKSKSPEFRKRKVHRPKYNYFFHLGLARSLAALILAACSSARRWWIFLLSTLAFWTSFRNQTDASASIISAL